MSTGTVSACGGHFYDSGKDTADYSSNENHVLTICPDVTGNCVSLHFTFFQLENNFDFLYVYNGPTTASPLIGTYTGNNSPGTISATSGCLTIRFVSDYTVNKAGWIATISCAPCPVNGCPTCNGGQPPANDACSGAQNLGLLPIPAACPSGLGQVVTFNTTNICATPEIPYNALQGCTPVGSMATPASDVWYKFTITGPILNITIHGMITPEVGLYSGSGCNNLVPRACAIGGGGVLNTSFSGLAPGTYYLRVSGGTLTDQCNFTLSLQNNLDCQGCVVQSGLTVNPPPQNGIYLAGQSVNFCLHITGYLPSSANWLHAVIPSFGPGWDTSTITASPPLSCSGNGTWGWYNHQVTSSSNGFTTGPGFFYETAAGNPLGVADNNPGNNFGDNFTNNCSWNFCFTIHTKLQPDCITGQNLNVFIHTYGDGETGSWTSTACAGDPVNDFYANIACCMPPAISVVNPLCHGQKGSATGTGLSNGPWTFAWKDSSGTLIRQTTSALTDQILNLSPGTYSLTTTDVTGCLSTTVFVIAEPQKLTASVTINNTKCSLSNGSISITATGGTVPYVYSKNNGVSYQVSSVLNNLAAGVYNVQIKDAHGCIFDTAITVAPSTLPVIDSVHTQDIKCYNGLDGAIDVFASSGIAPYTYSVNGGALFQNSSHFGNLSAGTYHVVVSDINGCTTQTTVILGQPPPVVTQILTTPAHCGLNDGTITINVLSGTTGTLSYSITNGNIFQSSNYFPHVSAGIYFIEVLDGNGCLTHDTAIVSNINSPVLNSVTSSNLTCYHSANGSISMVASGGVGTLQYSIDGGTTFFNSGTFNNLIAGSYTLVIKDQNDCRRHAHAVLTEPLPIIIRADLINTTCGLNNGALSLHPDNGVHPFQYSTDSGATWQSSHLLVNLPSGSVTVTVRDSIGCISKRTYIIGASNAPTLASLNVTNPLCYATVTGAIVINTTGGTPPIKYSIDSGITFSNINSFTSLVAGNYNIVVKDNRGCSSDSLLIINQPSQINITATHVNAKCGLPNGSITANANGGVAPFTYSNDGGLTFAASNTFNNLYAGSYKVVAKDANGCVEATTVIISDALGPRIINVQTTPQICDGVANASIILTVVSGSGTLQFSIDSGLTFSVSPSFQNLYAGNYFIYAEDTNGCKDSASTLVGIFHSPAINQVITSNFSCTGISNDSISINASGGNGQLFYSINSGNTFFTTHTFNSVLTGTYYIVVKDSNNCIVRDTAVITQPPALILSNTVSPDICNLNNGSIHIHVIGGTPNYLFNINANAYIVDSNFTLLNAGNYLVHVVDNNGCKDSINITIPLLAAPHISSISITNVNCNSIATGSITINASGGNGNLSYSIDSGFTVFTSNIFTGLSNGNYFILVTDTNNCPADSAVAITEPPPFVFSFVSVPASCSLSNGSFTVTASGGSGALTFLINHTGAYTSNTVFNNLASGNYTVTVKDALNCTQDFVASVSNLNGPVIQSVTSTNLKCNGINIGSIIINAVGGNGLLTYSIDNGATFTASNSFSNLAAATYSIVVTDSVGCAANNSAVINQPPSLVINQQTTNASCGQNNGSILLSINGGTAPYLSSIDSVTYQSSLLFNNLFAGGYTITVKDSNSCVAIMPASISNLLAPTIASVSSNNLICYHDSAGQIIVHANGGSGNLLYSITNGVTYQSSNVFQNLIANSYTVVVSDTNHCLADTVITITEPQKIIVSSQVTTATCNQNNGTITLTASGGTGTLVYSINQINYTTSNIFSNLLSGNYTLSAKDASGCVKNINASVNNLNGPAIQSVSATNILCNGNHTGSITINASGGSGTLSYSIDNGLTHQSTNQYTNLQVGNYAIVVNDTAGCFANLVAVIAQPPPLIVAAQTTNPACGHNDGSITLNVTGGTGILTYSIDSINYQPSNVFNNLYAGTYTLIVHDSNNCAAVFPATISNQLAPVINSLVVTNLSCYHNQSGLISIAASGGTGNLVYSINNGITYQPSNIFNTLAAGTYYVAVKDQNGCLVSNVTSITEPADLILSPTVQNETCSNINGSIVIAASGGTSPYLYSNDSGVVFTNQTTYSALSSNTYNMVVEDNKGCKKYYPVAIANLSGPQIINYTSTNVRCNGGSDGSITVNLAGGNGALSYTCGNITQQGNVFANLVHGNYVITVTDTNSCYDTLHVTITQPFPLAVAVSPVNPSCNGLHNGTAAVVVNGGIPSYSILWSNGVSNNFALSNLAAGIIYFTVHDQHLCSLQDSVILTQPLPLTISSSIINNFCYGASNGSASVTVSGGTLPYTYLWSPVSSNTNYINNLSSGYYTVTATDANSCSIVKGIHIISPSPVTSQYAMNNVNCFGGNNGSITIHAGGGTPPYLYSWPGLTEDDSVITSLTTGTYTVVITDNNGCTLQNIISITSPPQINVYGIINNAKCYGYNNGSISLNTSGGVSPYTYNWSNGSTQSNNQNLSAGNYSVTVTDAHNCMKHISYILTQPTPVILSSTPLDTICIGQQSILSCNASGGSGTYSYLWNTGQSTQSISVSPTTSTSYNVYASDSAGCLSKIDTSFVFVHPPLATVVSPGDTICEGKSVSLSAVPSGGNGGPYFFSWNPSGSTSQQVTVQPATTTIYIVSVSDNCTLLSASASALVVVNLLPVVNFSILPTEGCTPLTVNFINQSNAPTGSVYNWNLGDGSAAVTTTDVTHQYTVSGNYEVTLSITTPQHCSDSLKIADAIKVFPVPEAAFTEDPFTATIFNPQISFTDQSILASTWLWNFGDDRGTSSLQNPSYSYSDTGKFTVQLIVESSHLCADTSYNEVIITGEYTLYIPNAFTPNGDGKNELFFAVGYDITDMNLVVFNRWGNKVFEGNGANAKWNGKENNMGADCPEDTYVYRLETQDFKKRIHVYSGRVSLLR